MDNIIFLEAQFQKSCYDCFATNTALGTKTSQTMGDGSSWSYSISSTQKYGVMVDDEAKKISLSDFKEKTAEERNKLAQRFNLEQASSQLSNSNMSLDEFVEQADTEMLKNLTLEDLIIPFKHSKLKFAFLDEEKFNALTIKDLDEEINEDQFLFIRQRLGNLYKNGESTQEQKTIDEYSDVKDIPTIAFAFFTNDQLQDLKLSELQTSQNKELFFALDEVETKGRLALFDDQDVVYAIHKGMFTGNVLKFLSDEHLNNLILKQLSKDQVSEIFDWKSDPDLDKKHFAIFTAGDVQEALETGVLSEYRLSLLSDDQLNAVKLSKLCSP